MLAAGALSGEVDEGGSSDKQNQQSHYDSGHYAAFQGAQVIGALHGKALLEEQGADEDADNEDGIDTDRSFENALFSAYYDECAHSKSRFLRQWADFDRNLRNISAAVVARVTGRSAEQSVVGGDETSQQLKRSSAADFGLRGDVPYLEAVIAAVNDETNLVEKERKIDAIRWNQAEELSTFDYFDINALLAYLVKVNIVARWTRLDDKQGREMLHRLMTSLDGKDLINKQ